MISAKDLSECDLLALDCEGCELSLIKDIHQHLKSVIAEVHKSDVSVVEIKNILQDEEYYVDIIPHRWGNLEREYDIRESVDEYYNL
jgi:hypothetical protein